MPSPPLALFIVMLFIPSPSDLICMCACVLSHFSCVKLCVTAWLQPTRLLCSWGFSGQEYWCGLLCPPPGDLPNPGIKPASLTSASAGGFYPPALPGKLVSREEQEKLRRNRFTVGRGGEISVAASQWPQVSVPKGPELRISYWLVMSDTSSVH